MTWVWMVVGAIVALRVFVWVHQIRVLFRARARRASYRLLEEGDLPPYLSPLAEFVTDRLGRLGLEPEALAYGHDATAWTDGYHLVLSDEARATWAIVRPSPVRTTPVYLSFVTVHDDGALAHVTVQCGDIDHVPSAAGFHRTDSWAPEWRDALRAHEEGRERLEAEGHPAMATDAATMFAVLTDREAASYADSVVAGWATPTDDGELRLTWRGVIRARRRLVAVAKLLGALRRGTQGEAPPPAAETLARFHVGRDLHAQRKEPAAFAWTLALISAAAFGVGATLFFEAPMIPGLMFVLLFHELGHWTAMRAFGYRNARIFFIPFFGAAAAGTNEGVKLWQELAVLYAGPVPGLVVGGALAFLAAASGDAQHWLELAILMLVLNGLNLLPFFPLDGGRIVHRLLHVDSLWLDAGLRALASVAFLGGAIATGDYVIGALGVIGLVGIPNAVRIGRLARSLRDRGAHTMDREAQLVAIYREMLDTPALAKASLAVMIARAVQARERLRRVDEPFSRRLVFLLLYGATLAGVVAVVVGLIALAHA
ncbi:MAG: site-2 protease family protein [Sandaracinaceae bacterium]